MRIEVTLRDTFAAAALSGLLGSREWPIDSGEAAAYCYRVADAMLRERAKKNHYAAPAATASVDSVAQQPTTGGRDRTDKAAAQPVDGTGDSQEPLAWAVMSGDRVYDIYDIEGEAVVICRWLRDEEDDGLWVTVPLYPRVRQSK